MTAINGNVAVAESWDERVGLDVEALKQSFVNHVAFTQGKVPGFATKRDLYVALAMMVRDRLIERWIATRRAYYNNPDTKRVFYLSLEFLIGRTLGNSLINLHLYDECYQALYELGYDLEDLRDLEEEAGLGNGGLGRLAACFLDSMATLELPGYGYGIRYNHGMFVQRLRDGQQIEDPDDWLRLGSPWEIARPEHMLRVQFYGRVEPYADAQGRRRYRWIDTHDVMALPYDMPVPGYRNNTVNTLRLFAAKSTREFDLNYFNHGDYIKACEDKALTENITKVLYPKDDFVGGKELRLKQEYLLVSASLQEILLRFAAHNDDWHLLPERVAIQLNDTHPALAIPELMRLLMDREGLVWDEAWDITVRTFAYTNHTVLPEAMEKWGLSLLGNLLPRHLEIIFEINRRFLDEVGRRYPNDDGRLARMSLIEEGDGGRVRMAHLAIVGSHSVNGVSALHTRILKEKVLRDFHEFYPGRFNNKTNGITPRRWLKKANAPLAYLIGSAIGDGWVTELDQLRQLIPLADDPAFQEQWREVKRLNKEGLAAHVRDKQGVVINPDAMLDCQVKRIHEYKTAIAEYPSRDNALQPAQERSGRCIRSSDSAPGREGGSGVLPRQADHPPCQLCRQGDQQRPFDGGASPGGLHRELRCCPGRAHHPGRGAFPADFHRRHGGLRDREHEVRPQRRVDHRNAGRCQRGDSGGGWRREHFHIWSDGRRGRGPPGAGTTRRTTTTATGNSGTYSTRSGTISSAWEPRACSSPS